MAKKTRPTPALNITSERAKRLFRQVALLGRGTQTRAGLMRTLGLNMRGFYRDLEVLRSAGIDVALVKGRYRLTGDPTAAVELLPFPDPGLTVGEARQLARGRSPVHRKLRAQLAAIEQ